MFPIFLFEHLISSWYLQYLLENIGRYGTKGTDPCSFVYLSFTKFRIKTSRLLLCKLFLLIYRYCIAGLQISPLQLRWMTERFNRSITRFGSHCPGLLRSWFWLGSVVSTALILPSIYLLVLSNCLKSVFNDIPVPVMNRNWYGNWIYYPASLTQHFFYEFRCLVSSNCLLCWCLHAVVNYCIIIHFKKTGRFEASHL